MFFDENTEREILHNSTSKKPYSNKKIVGGGDNGVKELKSPKLLPSSSMSGGSKRPPTEWQTLLKKTMTEQKLNMKNAIKYIKDNNLYQKK